MAERKLSNNNSNWLGQIPPNWDAVRINALYTLRNNKVNDTDYPPLSVTKRGIVPQMESVAKSYDNQNRKLVKKGDFVINSRSDRRGSCGISPHEGSVSLINTVLQPQHNMVPEYFDWLFNTTQFADEFYKWGHGIVDDLWTTGWEDMRRIIVPFPPLDVQKAIATIITQEVGEVDSIITDIQKEIETLEAYKKSVITEAVTKGLDPDVEMKDSGVEWIGEIPEKWKVTRLKYISLLIMKGIGPNYIEEVGTKVVNQATFSKGYFDHNLRYCSDSIQNPTRLMKYDVLIATTGGGVLGKTHFLIEEGEYLPSTDVAFIRTNEKNISKFIYYCLYVNYDMLNEVMGQGSTNQTHLQMGLLKNMLISLPTVEETKKIINILDKKCDQIAETIYYKLTQIQTLEQYKKSLIYEYVTGKKEVPHA